MIVPGTHEDESWPAQGRTVCHGSTLHVATSAFGTYTATYAQTGRELRVTKLIRGSRGTLPPTAAPALLAWLKEMGTDDVRFVVVEPAKAGD
jgi:hypothetical protein